jgi:citrate/tricarballylate utilization protein
MERRMTFTRQDVNYLANLCHQCGECFYACQYAPPHEFAVNVPRVMAQARLASYEEFAAPRALAASFRHGAEVNLAARWLSMALALVLGAVVIGWERLVNTPAGADFYALIPHAAMAGTFGAVGAAVAIALAVAVARYWRSFGEPAPTAGEFAAALCDALRLEYLRSGGAGCTYPDEHHSDARRWFHHAAFYGFALCFASTTVAAFYHLVLGLEAPYAYTSLPVVLGTLGGIGLLIGPAGLFILKQGQDPRTANRRERGFDVAFTVLLFSTSATGLALAAMRATPLMGLLLVVHLATVFALFLTMPYGKFVHGFYRAAALVRYAMERRK